MKREVRREQYYTDPVLASRCVEFARGLLDFASYACIVEPGAGDGAFFRLLPPDRRVGVDLEPRCDGVERADFLHWTPTGVAGPVLTIGNPPFGQRAALALRFIERAASFSEAIAFILPRSFNKYTFSNRVPLQFHLRGSFDCDEFRVDGGEEISVRTVFQVWQREDRPREPVRLADRHPHFEMRHCHLSRTAPEELARIRATHAFTIPQVGADFRPRDPASVVRGSHWFIRPLVPGVRERFDRLDFSFLDGMNTAHKSLSKRDIVRAYEAVDDGGAAPAGSGSTR